MISQQRLEDFAAGKIKDGDLSEAEVLDLQERVLAAILIKKLSLKEGLVFGQHDTIQ